MGTSLTRINPDKNGAFLKGKHSISRASTTRPFFGNVTHCKNVYPTFFLAGAPCERGSPVQGYLAHKKTPPLLPGTHVGSLA